MYLGIEIGGTKLQVGVGAGDGVLAGLWRGSVDVAAGPEGIRQQIQKAVPELLSKSGVAERQLRGVGIGFGGPIDDATQTIIQSFQIPGWDGFPLADWVGELVGLPAALGNDADVAGLAEALFGAGKGLSPIFYITIGSGIGGGLIINGEIYRGCGRGAAEIGHLLFGNYGEELEGYASGWAIQRAAQRQLETDWAAGLRRLSGGAPITVPLIAKAAEGGDSFSLSILYDAWDALAVGIRQVIALLCPRRIILGGGVSLLGQALLLRPLRQRVDERIFPPFRGLTDIVPAALGEEVVVHGALALARRRFPPANKEVS